MTLQEYQQKTHETAVYPAEHAKEYLLLGLAGEVGEICNKYKKTIRDNKPIDKDDMVSELGDVMWYFSELCNYYEYKLKYNEDMYTAYTDTAYTDTILEVSLGIYENIYNIYYIRSRNLEQYGKLLLNRILNDVKVMCKYMDTDLEEVLTKNIAKLHDRKNRGVIQGSGDNR